MSPFKGTDIDDLLTAVRRSSDRVRACAEGMMDNIIVVTHQTVHDNYETTQNIHNITQQTEDEVGELRGKIEEILHHQKGFQLTLDSISGKNSLLSFLTEYLSKFKLTVPSSVLYIPTNPTRTRAARGGKVTKTVPTRLRAGDARNP